MANTIVLAGQYNDNYSQGTSTNQKGLTQAAAAKVLGIDQPKVSALLRGKLTGFSTERLIKFLNALGRDVQIVVNDRSDGVLVAFRLCWPEDGWFAAQ